MRFATLLAILLAGAPAAQDPCRHLGLNPFYGPFISVDSFFAWGDVEFVPTAAGIAMLVRSYYPAYHLNPNLPLRNTTQYSSCEPLPVMIYGWWWMDTQQVRGDTMGCPDGSLVDLWARPTGWMISPTVFRPGHEWNWTGCSANRVQAVGREEPAICPTYAAYLLLPARGWW